MANIEDIWKKLEKPKPRGMTRNLSSRENIIHEDSEHLNSNGFEDVEQILTEQNGMVNFGLPLDVSKSVVEDYEDPFDGSDENVGYDEEVETINLNNRLSREFSLSQYDVNVRQFHPGVVVHSHDDGISDNGDVSPSEIYEDDFEESDHYPNDIAEGYFAERDGFIPSVKRNKGYLPGEVYHEDAGSGHVICDCDDCINQTEAVDCECENCVQTRDRTIDVPESREVTCYCEDCVNHWKDPDYICNCEHCVFEREQRVSESGDQGKEKCNCPECLAQAGHITEDCNCEKCNQSADKNLHQKDRQSSLKGSSQEYQHLDLRQFDEQQQQSDKSFDSGTEHSYRSTRSKGSYSDSSSITRGSHSDYSSIHKGSNDDILSKQLGSVQLNDSYDCQDTEDVNSHVFVKHDYNLCSDIHCIKCFKIKHKGSNFHTPTHGVADLSFEADEHCQCETCQLNPTSRHKMSSPVQVDITA